MSDKKNVFTDMEGSLKDDKSFRPDGGDYCNPFEFKNLVMARRSVRKFTTEKIPDDISMDCVESGLLAPNSSNLQTWEFIRVKNPEMIQKLAVACFSQSAARTASELIVCIARTDKALEHCQLTLDELKKLPVETPKAALQYYGKLAPFVYNVGPMSLYAPFKWLFFTLGGLFKVVPREPLTKGDIKLWAVKSCALACENIMLAYRSHGFDTCPMEGYDSKRVKKILNLNSDQHLVMIIGAGRADTGGIYGPQMRFSKERFIKTI
jgi:nitroreductase